MIQFWSRTISFSCCHLSHLSLILPADIHLLYVSPFPGLSSIHLLSIHSCFASHEASAPSCLFIDWAMTLCISDTNLLYFCFALFLTTEEGNAYFLYWDPTNPEELGEIQKAFQIRDWAQRPKHFVNFHQNCGQITEHRPRSPRDQSRVQFV